MVTVALAILIAADWVAARSVTTETAAMTRPMRTDVDFMTLLLCPPARATGMPNDVSVDSGLFQRIHTKRDAREIGEIGEIFRAVGIIPRVRRRPPIRLAAPPGAAAARA